MEREDGLLYYMTRESIVEIFRRWNAAECQPRSPENCADRFIEFGQFEMASNAAEG